MIFNGMHLAICFGCIALGGIIGYMYCKFTIEDKSSEK